MGLTRPRAHQLQDSDFKQSVRAIQTSNITLSGGAPSTVDGVSVSLGDRILVTGQSTASQNGIYVVTTVGSGSNGTWARSADADTTGDMTAGMVVMVTEGTSNADTSWKITTNDPITLDTTSITFEQSSAYGYGTISVAGQDNIVADQVGDTLTVAAGNNIAVTTTAGSDTLTVAVSDSINTSGTITATGNITGGNLVTSGTVTLGGTLVTATAAELNILDGVTATATELNLLDGVTGTLVTEAGTQTLTNKSISGSQINSGTIPDARIASSSITQHEGDLTITESQISDLSSYITASSTDTLTNKTLTAPTLTGSTSGADLSLSGNLTVTNIATYNTVDSANSNIRKINQRYTGASSGSYFEQNEYQKVVTITPSGNSQNYQISGRIIAQSGSSIQTIYFEAGLRSNVLPDLDFSITFYEQHNGTAFVKPQLWTKETTTAGFILAFQYIHSASLYGSVTVDMDIVPRNSSDKNNITVNTSVDSEQTTVDTGFTANEATKIYTINGDDVDIVSHDGGTDGLKLGGTLITSTATELNLLDGVTGTLVTEAGTQTLTNKSISGSQINSGTIPDARIQSSGVTQHQASLSITESQISDLGTYLTSPIGLGDIAGANVITSGESFSDTDNALMTAASINDRIQSFGYTTNTGDILGVTAGTGLSGGGSSGTVTLNLDFSELTDMTGDISGSTEFILQNGTTESRKAASEIKLSAFNNDSGFTTTTGTVTSHTVSAGSGLTGGGTITTSGTTTVNVGAGTLIDVTADAVNVDLSELTTSTADGDGDFFAVVDTSNNQKKLTKGSINISGFNNDAGYTTNTGDITRVNITAGTGLSGTQDTTSGDHTQTLAIDSTVATLTGSQTLTNKTLTSPQVTTDIRLNAQAELEFYDSDSSNYVSFRAPATIGSNITWTLPSSDGTEDQVLSTNGAGTLSWADAGSGGGSGSSYPNSTFSTLPGTDGDFDLSYNVAQTSQETPFEAGGTDAFGVNLGSVFSLMDPIGSIETSSETGLDLGALT